jgi:hypothetical protein
MFRWSNDELDDEEILENLETWHHEEANNLAVTGHLWQIVGAEQGCIGYRYDDHDESPP